jgi:hypothetical protein
MENIFDMDLSQLKKLEQFAKDSPKLFASATANVLNTLAFQTRENDISEITKSMTVRNPNFVKSNLRVQKARSGRIESQVAIAYSVPRENFSGWEEQQNGGEIKKTIQTSARGGNVKGRVKPKYRLRQNNEFEKPDNYPGRNRRSSFYAMLRIMSTRRGGEFILTDVMPLKHGQLKAGLFSFHGHKLQRLQMFSPSRVRANKWRDRSVQRVMSSNTAAKAWEQSIEHVIEQSQLKK